MRKQLHTLLALLLATMAVQAQTFVSTTPSNRNVVLEIYKGINDQYSPEADKIADGLAVAFPGRVFPISIHQGYYANATPDYRTQWGDALAGQTGLTGYPSGTVNRYIFTGTETSKNRSDWADYANNILGQASCVNVAAQSTIDWNTRTLTVTVEAYYTSNSSTATNYLNVALLQDSVVGPQIGASAHYTEMIVYNNLYYHNHMLRDLLTEQWGVEISATTAGSFYSRTFTYTLPQHINKIPLLAENIKVAVFIAEGHQDIITGAYSDIEHLNIPTIMRMERFLEQDITQFDYTNGAMYVDCHVKSKSPVPVTSYVLGYRIDDGTEHTFPVTGQPIGQYETDLATIPVPIASGMGKQLKVYVKTINGTDFLPDTAYMTIRATLLTVACPMKIKLWTDQYGSETTWQVVRPDGTLVSSGGPYENLFSNGTTLREFDVQLEPGSDYRFEIHDSYGDGINNGYGFGKYELWSDGEKVYESNGKFQLGETIYLQTTGSSIPEPVTYTVTLTAGEGISLLPNAGAHTATEGESFTFYVSLLPGYEGHTPQASVNGQPVVLQLRANGTEWVYAIPGIGSHQTVTVSLATTGNDDPDGTRLYSRGGQLIVETPVATTLAVYSTGGHTVVVRRIPAGTTAIPLPGGSYIVRLGRQTEKVVVHE